MNIERKAREISSNFHRRGLAAPMRPFRNSPLSLKGAIHFSTPERLTSSANRVAFPMHFPKRVGEGEGEKNGGVPVGHQHPLPVAHGRAHRVWIAGGGGWGEGRPAPQSRKQQQYQIGISCREDAYLLNALCSLARLLHASHSHVGSGTERRGKTLKTRQCQPT